MARRIIAVGEIAQKIPLKTVEKENAPIQSDELLFERENQEVMKIVNERRQ